MNQLYTLPKVCLLALLAALIVAPAAKTENKSATPIKVTMGDSKVDGSVLRPYHFSWRQCAVQHGDWVSLSDFDEQLRLTDDGTIQLIQTTVDPSQKTAVATHSLNQNSLSRSKLNRVIRDNQGKTVATTETVFSSTGYTTIIEQDGQFRTRSGDINIEHYSGMYLGLVLSTLNYSLGSFELLSSMMQFDGTYTITARRTGKEQINVRGQDVEVQLVDVHWEHHQSGDMYPPGPEASGGRYWLVINPPANVPHVLAYKTDSYAIEYVPMTCKL